MKKITFVISVLTLLTLTACSELGVNDEKRVEINTNFYQRWVQSYEEQSANPSLNIFRPADSREFPQSSFRMQFTFDTNGECSYKDKSTASLKNCVFTKIGEKVYLYDQHGKLLSHLIFTLVEEPSKDKMRMTYGIKKPAVKKEGKK